jgi:hypothetical protein
MPEFEVMVRFVIRAESLEEANRFTESVLPSVGYEDDDCEVVDYMLDGTEMLSQ